MELVLAESHPLPGPPHKGEGEPCAKVRSCHTFDVTLPLVGRAGRGGAMATRAQRLRKNPTVAEIRFWRLIEQLRLGGYHFRKQCPIGPYVVDFACHHARLIVEIDGDSHFMGAGPTRDARRTAFLEAEGYAIVRFTNLDVMTNPDGVYAAVVSALSKDSSHD